MPNTIKLSYAKCILVVVVKWRHHVNVTVHSRLLSCAVRSSLPLCSLHSRRRTPAGPETSQEKFPLETSPDLVGQSQASWSNCDDPRFLHLQACENVRNGIWDRDGRSNPVQILMQSKFSAPPPSDKMCFSLQSLNLSTHKRKRILWHKNIV